MMQLVEFTQTSPVEHSTDLTLIVVNSLDRACKALARFGYDVLAYSDQALQKLPELPDAKIRQIIANFDSMSEWIEPLDPRYPFEAEVATLRRALDKYGFEADPEFWKTLEKGQIVEFYGEDMVQLYRSFNFFAITGYSLLDISVFEWYVLWDRPKQILENLVGELNETLQTYVPVRAFRAPKHLVREIFNTKKSGPFVPRASWLEPLHLGTLRSSRFTRSSKKGFICTSRGEMIAKGKEAENIQFI